MDERLPGRFAEMAAQVDVVFLLDLGVPPSIMTDVHEDVERCVRAVQSKDARFDGWFFTAVVTTGIYCRPSCPVVPPKVENMRFYPSAAAAQHGRVSCLQAVPARRQPRLAGVERRADVVARAMRLIADGVVDRDGVPGLAAALGYSVRQVERQLRPSSVPVRSRLPEPSARRRPGC